MFCVCTIPALVDVTETVYVPAGVEVAVAIVIVDIPDELGTEAGLNEAVAPAGSPLALKVTVPMKLLEGETVRLYAADWPAMVVADEVTPTWNVGELRTMNPIGNVVELVPSDPMMLSV